MKRVIGFLAVVMVVSAAFGVGLALRKSQGPRILIEAYYPFRRQGFFIADYLEALAQRYPGKVKFVYICYGTDEGYEKWRQRGLECGGVFINGRNNFEVVVNGKWQQVRFVKRMGVYWTAEQFEAALVQVMKEVYPRG
ncbi:MAG TPA: hypothetical protein EYP85_03015 [Armatimonadetes bacterium]|nr:hypothetical protein [Armatimonadota bacterium]